MRYLPTSKSETIPALQSIHIIQLGVTHKTKLFLCPPYSPFQQDHTTVTLDGITRTPIADKMKDHWS